MTSRRELGETLADVGGGVLDALAADPGITVRNVVYALPIEFAVSGRGGEAIVLGDVPRLITRTAFDIPPTRVEFRCVAELLP